MVSKKGRSSSPDTDEERLFGPRLLTLSEVSYLLHAHPNSVRRWSDAGLLPAVRIGTRGDRRFRLQDVERFLEGRPKATGKPQPAESSAPRKT